MTVVDSSALMAVLLQEPDAQSFADALESGEPLFISAATFAEAGIVALRRGGGALLRQLEAFVREAEMGIMPLTEDHARAAIDAYRRYGFGTGQPRCLNYGDCFSYSLARILDQPLLYKGEDFARTDIRSAL